MSNNKPTYLSKSDFTLALDCRTKLYYKKMRYPTSSSEYIDLLRAGGYMIGKIAQLLYDGIEIEFDGDITKSKDLTSKYLKENKNIILYEATLYIDNLLARVDILKKTGDTIKIIEVKSTAFDLIKFEPRSKKFITEYSEKLDDIAFQYYILKKVFPDKNLKASLMMPDKNKVVCIDNMPSLFSMSKDKTGTFYNVEFTGEIDEIRKSNFLTEVDVTDIVLTMQNEVKASVTVFLGDLIGNTSIKKFNTPLNKECKKCEFRATIEDTRDGFKECWGELANVEPHVLDLYYMGTIGGTKEPLVNKLITEKKVSLFDMPETALKGAHGNRQTIQIKYTKDKSEWTSDELRGIMKNLKYPLHFIDFEASVLSVPYHKGMRPYEKVAFQWSCHSIEKLGEEPKHFEWINVDTTFPNFDFANSLKDCIKDSGTVLTWASYENTTLREIKEQIDKYGNDDKALKSWLEKLVKTKENPDTRIVDLNDLTLKHYFHPLMKGRTSLKWVLPAVWNNDSKLYQYKFSKKYYKDENGKILDPYETLPKIDIAEEAEVVKEGTGAMMAYQEMLYGQRKNDKTTKDRWKNLLLQYCELDTAAMVLVWKHWENILNIKN